MNICKSYFVCGDSHSFDFFPEIKKRKEFSEQKFQYKHLGNYSILCYDYPEGHRHFKTGVEKYLESFQNNQEITVFIHSDQESRCTLGDEIENAEKYIQSVNSSLNLLLTRCNNLLFFDLFGIKNAQTPEMTCTPPSRVKNRRFVNEIIRNRSDVFFWTADEDLLITDNDGFIIDEKMLKDSTHYNPEYILKNGKKIYDHLLDEIISNFDKIDK